MPSSPTSAAGSCLVCNVTFTAPVGGASLPCGHLLCRPCQIDVATAFIEGGRAAGGGLRFCGWTAAE